MHQPNPSRETDSPPHSKRPAHDTTPPHTTPQYDATDSPTGNTTHDNHRHNTTAQDTPPSPHPASPTTATKEKGTALPERQCLIKSIHASTRHNTPPTRPHNMMPRTAQGKHRHQPARRCSEPDRVNTHSIRQYARHWSNTPQDTARHTTEKASFF